MSNNIYRKLQEARVQLQNLNIKKTGKNKHTGFSYFELSDFLPSINKIFFDLNLFSHFSISNDTAVLNIINNENTEEIILFTIPTAELELKGCNAIQELGGVNTYCKRYLYLNALEIVESDLFDATTRKQEETKPKNKKIKEETNQTEITEVANNNLDLIVELDSFNTIGDLVKFFNEHKNDVGNFEEFNKAFQAKRKSIMSKGA